MNGKKNPIGNTALCAAATTEAMTMYEELIARLLEDKSWIEQGTTETEHEIADHLQKTADAIKELTDKNVGKWIPVTERLPECEWGAEVGNIEWISRGMVFAGCFGRGGKYRDAYFRTWTDGTEGINAKDADHWRQIQIPEPPKEET